MRLNVTGYSGVQVVSLMKTVTTLTGSLSEAERPVEGLLDGTPFLLEVPDDQSEQFMNRVRELGATCEVAT